MARVVITGMGVVAPNAHGLEEFETALREGISGCRYHDKLKELGFRCHVSGIPQGIDELKTRYFSEEVLHGMNSNMTHAGIAAIDCWKDAGLPFTQPWGSVATDWDTGAIVGCGIGGMDTIIEKLVPALQSSRVRRMGSTMVERIMASAPSAWIGGCFGLGGQVTTNSSACTTGTEAVVNAYIRIRDGYANRMLAGGSEGAAYGIWAGFDAMRVLSTKHNDQPEKASRPMSASAAGFVPAAGAGILMLESLESARKRGARIYAEVLGGHVNCGGQRAGGTMTAPGAEGVRRCIRATIAGAEIDPGEIDVINGHLTATMADPIEIKNWQGALECRAEELPLVNATKSLIGHGLGAAGGMECVASVLQLSRGFVHGSVNCEDLHPELEPLASSIVQETLDLEFNVLARANFGFGDVNGCLILGRWQQ